MVIAMIFNSREKITGVFENKEKIKVDVGIVARSGATWKKAIFFGCISGNAAWRYEKSSLHHSCTYTSGEEGSTSSIRPDNSLGKTMVQVGTSVGREGKDTREKRERERERTLTWVPLNQELEQWKLVNFKRIFDRIADIGARKWEKNIRRTPLMCVDTPGQWKVCT